jgi:hypothetical protein
MTDEEKKKFDEEHPGWKEYYNNYKKQKVSEDSLEERIKQVGDIHLEYVANGDKSNLVGATIPTPPNDPIDDAFLITYRLEALKLAMEMALKIDFFQDEYLSGKDGLLKDIDILHEIAAQHVKFLLGNK